MSSIDEKPRGFNPTRSKQKGTEFMQKRFQQLAGAALDSLGLSRIEDEQLIAHLDTLDEVESYLRFVCINME